MQVLNASGRGDGVLGNTSLLLSNIAYYAEYAEMLKSEDCIKALIGKDLQ